MSRIGAVVVHWRDLAATLACLASLTPEPEIDVLVVDNGSSDPLAVPRTFIARDDTLADFARKLSGAYDYLHRGVQFLRRWRFAAAA